jgi:hypothetical protein
MLDLTATIHARHASTGTGAVKIAARMIAAKDQRGWSSPDERIAAFERLVVLAGRTRASHAAAQMGEG